MTNLQELLITSITPYFLGKNNLWFEENLNKILETRKTQSFFEENTIFLEKNQSYNLSQLLRKLDEMGYEKVLEVSEIGEFSQRGGIIDVFPLNLNFAVRLEFLGNKIETLEKLPLAIENENKAKEILKKRLKSQKLFSDLKGLKSGDYLVHLDHGIGIYKQQVRFNEENYYQLEYAQGDKLYVPFGLERKLSRYIGFVVPKISRLASLTWQRTKKKIKEETEKLAKELLEIYAKREVASRPPYLPDDEIDIQLASSFPYEETADQLAAIKEINQDLEREKPMDRLVCGDVGFGKTEIALRAMVKAVKSGYQTIMLCPTTILAEQHYQNFKERLKDLPIKIAALSRLQSKREQKEIVAEIKNGKIDIIIGTHRLLSKDIDPHLFQKGGGLLVIDDEQRFGVKQKEKFKKLRASLDILSLSATPIPRTLYLTLSSLKEVSLIKTPPPGRLSVKTSILPFSEKVIKEAIEQELRRNGQVYYLHNRVETIETAKKFLENLAPQAQYDNFGSLCDNLSRPRRSSRSCSTGQVKIGIAHGRMKERNLIKVMSDFQEKKINVLVATTIIENGLDLPDVNTLIVADATKLGLSQAYQIRGRVGRRHLQAFAYFLYPPKFSDEKFRRSSGKYIAEKVYPVRNRGFSNWAILRLTILKEAEDLGSGYKIAMKDLEIRGAGNILGKEQSGSVNKVGLNLYCQMLSEAVEKLKIAEPTP